MLQNHRQGYGSVSIAMHWLTALAVYALFALGLWMVELTYYDSWYTRAPDLHRSVGVLLFLLVVLRLCWRWLNPRPEALGSHLENRLARLAHALMYLLLAALMISGYLISTADGRGIAVFDWFEVPATLQGLEAQEDIAGEIHELLAFTLVGLSLAHAGAALKHHFIDRDRTLTRMWLTRHEVAGRPENRVSKETP